MPFAEIDHRRFHYQDTGGPGPAVVLSHGNLMDGSMWDAQVAALRGEFRCISWDERLHGRTEDDGAPHDYWASARDLLGLLDHLGIERAALVGHSQGGFLSLRAALLAPERVRALVLVDSSAAAWPPQALAQMGQIAEGFRSGGPRAVAPALLDLLLGPGDLHTGLHAAWQARWERQPRERLATAVNVLMAVAELAGRLSEITAPALVIHGAADQPVPAALGVMLSELLPGAEPLVLIPDAGHTPPLTHPEPVNAALAGFLRARVTADAAG
ncbi:alpha/beta fold hydrolase [Kitasatospora kifunensis]|uniref:Pimeloyl-ACP methyl ester carboxylesterase n=1 Tax=Kitasatospora kifunensis TaxID=58351 RepID=A0A7W7QXK5_KITKI|nr:alpha/beta hydrolase [Kitasatospora kifunensis]MBB4921633.1 pimeloyl-ACP methyl ester carboxylesterase [Kitasatospora kifunensis]